jgi:hypothetical protein
VIGGAAMMSFVAAACGNDSAVPPFEPPSPTTSESATDSPDAAATTPTLATTAPTSAPETTSVPAPTAVAGGATISAGAYQVRTDEAVGSQFQTQVVNAGDEEFTVVAVRLVSPGFERLPFEPRSTRFVPGQTTDLTTPYGQVACDADLAGSAAGLRVQASGGATEEVTVPFASTDVLERIHGRECAAQAFAAAFDMHLGEMTVTSDGEAMGTTLVIERRDGDDPVVVEDTRGSVLISPGFTDTAGRELAAAEQALEMPYQFTVRSCMPHLLADVKKPFDFTVYLRIGDTEQAVALVTTDAERDVLWDYVLDFCATQA